jgi:multiple sugar transport system ATP-binding protein
MGDRVAVLREGRIIQVGTPSAIYDHPADVFVAQLVGTPRINLLPAQYEGGQIVVTDTPMRLNGATAQLPPTLLLGVRPEDVQPDANGEFAGQVALVEPLGVETILHITSGQKSLLALVSGRSAWQLGDAIRFRVVRERLHYFTEAGSRVI